MLHIINLVHGEELTYPLCLLRISGAKDATEGLVRNLSLNNANFESFPVIGNGINALILLVVGENKIEIQCGYETAKITLYYKPPEHNRSVRLLYVTCLNEEKFQGPSDMKRDANEAVRRIQIGALLLQTFLAECLNEEALGRKTFKLDMTKSGMPKVFVIQLPLTLQESYKFSEQKLWETVAMQILSSPLASRSCKYLAFFCGTRFSNPQNLVLHHERDILTHTKGHISLGGGGLALVGTGTLYSWASNMNEILPKFRNQKTVNTQELMDFSAKRGTWGACYGTHLGSVLHELGHTFDLGHTSEGIMSRGFEDFHIFFTSTFVQSRKEQLIASVASMRKNICSSMSSSLIKQPQTFTTDFVRKSIENISMVVEPPKYPHVSYAAYCPCSTPKTPTNEPLRQKHDYNSNDTSSPAFERFELLNLCLSQNIQAVEFTPRSPNQLIEENKFFRSPALKLKNITFPLNNDNKIISSGISDNNNLTSDTLSAENKTECKAYFTRSNAVFLSFHKWMNGNSDGSTPELKASVLCSNVGIRLVELRDMRMIAFHHWEYLHKNPPPIIHLPWAQVSNWPADTNIEVVAIDEEGGILKGCYIPRPL